MERKCEIPTKNVHLTPEMGEEIVGKVERVLNKYNEPEGYNAAKLSFHKSVGGYLQSMELYGDMEPKDYDMLVKEIEKILKEQDVEYKISWMCQGGAYFTFPYF